jgi:hypothetical protein
LEWNPSNSEVDAGRKVGVADGRPSALASGRSAPLLPACSGGTSTRSTSPSVSSTASPRGSLARLSTLSTRRRDGRSATDRSSRPPVVVTVRSGSSNSPASAEMRSSHSTSRLLPKISA